MGACASKFTVLKNSAAAPLPDVKQEVEAREVNQVVEEVVVNKDEAPAVDDEANRRQSLGHLLKESEIKKSSAEDVKQDDGAEVKPEAVSDVPAKDEPEGAPVAADSKLENVELEAEKVEEKPAETVKVETPKKVETLKTEGPGVNKGVAKEPEVLEVEKPASNEEEKPAEKIPEVQECEKTEELKPVSDAEKKETVEKSGEIEVSEKKPESLEAEKTKQKHAADAKKPAENTKTETSDKVDDKHILEPLKTENCSPNETPETISVEQKPASDAEKPKAEEVKANN